MHRRCVYFLRSDQIIKIGTTEKLSSRIREIERDIGAKVEFLGAVYGTFATERQLHKHFAHIAEGGEWFLDCPELRAAIRHLVANGPEFSGLPAL